MFWTGIGGLCLNTYIVSIDVRGRVLIPTPCRQALGPLSKVEQSSKIRRLPPLDLVVTAAEVCGSPCLALYPAASIAALIAGVDMTCTGAQNGVPTADTMFPQIYAVRPDPTGRIALSHTLRDHAQLHRDVRIAGAGDHFHLWNPSIYDRLQGRMTKMVGNAKNQMENHK